MALLEIQRQGPTPDILTTAVGEESPYFQENKSNNSELSVRAVLTTRPRTTYIIALSAPKGLLSRFADDETDAQSVSPPHPGSRLGAGARARGLLGSASPPSPLYQLAALGRPSQACRQPFPG